MEIHKWEVIEDGYHKRIRLVGDGGLILAIVSGCNCDSSQGWYALIQPPTEGGNLGEFTTEGLAKKAVEQHLSQSHADHAAEVKALREALEALIMDHDGRVKVYGPDPQLAKVKLIERARAALGK